ncbi:predicted protein [Sclerotinia sclerotiorum 1980 UF-70]|uniref:Uncharacterized protein n=2 Tax=Sclerotinia sclerotiorum (strain ATCC 18683 / 1980 / Ss-1) TaxID=665079 RepID=A7F357_SCLS1|nr:predicted protein [Sclerotinia sclerotiorum 1980 UF-70]APA09536.1 hypothetical protein sscle_05g043060 [Sclerotinia sclerotiorum 1980 UF-70]EDN96149.1 predicted protein [Sclerotinia sclerotiorum 1980 UF-70]
MQTDVGSKCVTLPLQRSSNKSSSPSFHCGECYLGIRICIVVSDPTRGTSFYPSLAMPSVMYHQQDIRINPKNISSLLHHFTFFLLYVVTASNELYGCIKLADKGWLHYKPSSIHPFYNLQRETSDGHSITDKAQHVELAMPPGKEKMRTGAVAFCQAFVDALSPDIILSTHFASEP